MMYLKKGFEKEYEWRHRNIWPEVKAKIEESGVYDYSIFLDQETDVLFAIQKCRKEAGSQDLGEEEIIRKWWPYMSDIMETK